MPATPSESGSCIECCNPSEAIPRVRPRIMSPDMRSLAVQDEPIGAVAGPRFLCLHAELPIDLLPTAFQEWSGVELPVVDDRGRLLGTIWRDDFVRTHAFGMPHAILEPPQRVVDRVGHATTVHESSSIEHSVEVLAGQHARTLILVQNDDTVAGVITDLDLLRWWARERRR
jgi:predicted transcriptional regulator